jgi:hypothetical protein
LSRTKLPVDPDCRRCREWVLRLRTKCTQRSSTSQRAASGRAWRLWADRNEAKRGIKGKKADPGRKLLTKLQPISRGVPTVVAGCYLISAVACRHAISPSEFCIEANFINYRLARLPTSHQRLYDCSALHAHCQSVLRRILFRIPFHLRFS